MSKGNGIIEAMKKKKVNLVISPKVWERFTAFVKEYEDSAGRTHNQSSLVEELIIKFLAAQGYEPAPKKDDRDD